MQKKTWIALLAIVSVVCLFSYTEMAKRVEAALRKANKDVEVKYYEGSGHNALFTDPSQFDDTVERVSSFLPKKLEK